MNILRIYKLCNTPIKLLGIVMERQSACVLAILCCLLAALISLLRIKKEDEIQQAILASEDPTPQATRICELLSSQLPDKVFTRRDAVFRNSIKLYWSAQERSIVPACIFRPTTPSDVSKAIKIVAKEYDSGSTNERTFHFAVCSGGHAPNAEAANVQGGLVFDLSQLNNIEVSQDRQLTTIGTGARWGDVSRQLDSMNLAVTGGRANNVGVGGLTLGGGISFFSARTGFVCDNVVSFEMVLADGAIVNANEFYNRDLWIALKGGGNNFGVVTNITTRTFEQGKILSGFNISLLSAAPQLLDALYHFSRPETFDIYSHVILSLGYTYVFRSCLIGQTIQYTKPTSNPPALRKFMAAKRVWSTVKLKSLTAATEEVNSHCPPAWR